MKNAARLRILAARSTLSAAARAAAAARIQAATTDLVRRTAPTRIATYLPIGDEPGGPDLVPALLGALPPDATLLLPVLLPDLDLDWAEYAGGPLASGRFGLREPTGPRLGVAAIADADLIIVPALAVDRRGHRLGRGGGSYDRALARLPADPRPGALVVALLQDGELLREVPAGPHDRRVAGAVTPADGYIPCDLP